MLKTPDKLEKYGLTLANIATIYGYKDTRSFKNSKAYDKKLEEIVKLIVLIEEYWINELKN